MNRLVIVTLAAFACACSPKSEAPDDVAHLDAELAANDPGDARDGADAAMGDAAPASGPMQTEQAAAAPSGRRNLLRFEPAVIVDAAGFAQPIGAVSLFIPHGWRTEGGVVWASDYMCTNGYNFLWSATSPDGAMSIGVAPQAAWAYASGAPAAPQPGCPVMQITSARQYLEESVRKALPNARMLDFRERPDLLEGAKPSRTAMPMGEIQNYRESGEVLFAFSDAQGRDMRGSMAAIVDFQKMFTNASGLQMEQVNAFAHPGFVATAPNGQLNLAFFEALRRTMQANPQWLQKISGHNRRIAAVAIEEGRKRAAIVAKSNDEIARIRQETWDFAQASTERRYREFGEALRGVETYADADAPGGTVELSHMYRNAWRLNDGSYVLTDDPNFDPWRDLRVEGKQLEAVQ